MARPKIKTTDPMPETPEDMKTEAAEETPRVKRKYTKRAAAEPVQEKLPPEIQTALTASITAVAKIPFERRAKTTGDDRWRLSDEEAQSIGRGFSLWIDFRLTPYLGALAPELMLILPFMGALLPRLTMKPVVAALPLRAVES